MVMGVVMVNGECKAGEDVDNAAWHGAHNVVMRGEE